MEQKIPINIFEDRFRNSISFRGTIQTKRMNTHKLKEKISKNRKIIFKLVKTSYNFKNN